MAKRILVPIDEAVAAETLAPMLGALARDSGATIRLLHVAPTPEFVVSDNRIVSYVDQETNRLQAEALDRLHAFGVELQGVPVEYAVRFGDAATEILAEAVEFGADLVAVETTCRSGLTRTLLGSVAETVLRKAGASVLLLRPAVS